MVSLSRPAHSNANSTRESNRRLRAQADIRAPPAPLPALPCGRTSTRLRSASAPPPAPEPLTLLGVDEKARLT